MLSAEEDGSVAFEASWSSSASGSRRMAAKLVFLPFALLAAMLSGAHGTMLVVRNADGVGGALILLPE